MVYAASFGKFTLSTFFEPAREAAVPDVVPRAHLVAANGLSGLTWAVMLDGLTALGGLVVHAGGPELAFVLDSASFLLSAGFTAAVTMRESNLGVGPRPHPLRELREG